MQQQHNLQHMGGQTIAAYDSYSAPSRDVSVQIANAVHGGVIQHQQDIAGPTPFQFHDAGVAKSTGIELASDGMTYNGMQILGEQVIETEIKVPTIRRRESIRERTVIIPEKVITEHVVEETRTVRERIIQVAKPVLREKIVEYDQPEYVEKIVEVPEHVVEWKEIPVEKIIFVEKVREVKRHVEVEKAVQYEEIVHIDKPYVKQVEYPEIKLVTQEVPRPVDRYVTVDVPDYKDVETIQEVYRRVPVALEHITHQTYELPALEAEYEEVPYPVFVPAYTQVPIPADQMTDEAILQAEALAQKVALMAATQLPSLCVIEDLGNQARRQMPELITDPNVLQHKLARKVADYVGHIQPPLAVPEVSPVVAE